jgi:hypothetical protein
MESPYIEGDFAALKEVPAPQIPPGPPFSKGGT